MKTFASVAVVAGLLGATLVFGADMPAMKMSPAATNHAVGVVKSVDAANGAITIATEAVPAIQWPAMTMPYKISSELAAGVKPGNKVNIEFTAKGMDATITKISAAK